MNCTPSLEKLDVAKLGCVMVAKLSCVMLLSWSKPVACMVYINRYLLLKELFLQLFM